MQEPCACPRATPTEFRRKVLDLVPAAGRPTAQIALGIDISDQTIYRWRERELIEAGQLPGLDRSGQAELGVVNKRIRELDNEVAISKKEAPYIANSVEKPWYIRDPVWYVQWL